MLIEEAFTVKCPLPKLWDFLLDPKCVGPCFPGCEQVVPISEKEYYSKIKTRVGPIVVRFEVNTVIEDINPYESIHTVGEGREVNNLGRFKQETSIIFNKLSEDETEVSYRAEVSVVGRLGKFGDRVLRAKAKDMGLEFAEAVRQKISAQEGGRIQEEKLEHYTHRSSAFYWLSTKFAQLAGMIRSIRPFSK
ncbi:MAG: CoxG family protein [bacterium]